MLEQEELVQDQGILVRLPPDDPASLLRAALACKRWGLLISAPAFRRRFLELHHRAPPMLGFFVGNNFLSIADFVPTSSFRAASRFPKWSAIEARHGRVLLRAALTGDNKAAFAVWDPITRELSKLPLLPTARFVNRHGRSNAAVLCAASACSHLDCHRGPFLVVLVGIGFSYVYSSEAGVWTGWTSADAHQHHDCHLSLAPSVLLGNALYFMVCASSYNLIHGASNGCLKYDLGTAEMCRVRFPPRFSNKGTVPMAAKDGELRLARVDGSMLYLWSREAAGPANGVRWTQRRTIELETLLPADAILASIDIIGSADGVGVIFLRTDVGIFTFDLNSSRVKKVSEARHYHSVLPYVSFYSPALQVTSTDVGPRAGVTSA